jgi:hypothetical protein
MATTLGQLAGFLDEHHLRNEGDSDESATIVAFTCPPDDHD